MKIWKQPEFARFPTRPWLSGLCVLARLVLAGVFLWSGALKALDPGLFLLDVRSFQMLRDPWAAWLAVSLPWLEILCGLALLLGGWTRGALLILGSLLVVFAAALGQAWARGLDVTCGCFGKSDNQTDFPAALLRDGLLLALVVFVAWAWPRFEKRPA